MQQNNNNKEIINNKKSDNYYHQKALQEIRNSLQPYSYFSSNNSASSSPSQSPVGFNVNTNTSHNGSNHVDNKNNKRIEYRAKEYPFVPNQIPPSVQQLLRLRDNQQSPTSSVATATSSTRSSPINYNNKLIVVAKSENVPKPTLERAVPVAMEVPRTTTTTPTTVTVEEQPQPPPPPLPPKKNNKINSHSSPIPERKKLTKEMEVERAEGKIRTFSPAAYKFFMEQHVENVIKSHQERLHRRMQLESEMAKIGLSEEAQEQMRRMLCQKESNYIRLKRAKMDKSMFRTIRTIGVGAFGEVSLVQKLDSQPRSLYAMKTLRKRDVLRRNQVAHVKAERDILAEADCEWVVKLYYSFQDSDNLYFVMDYIPGGDLMSLLIKKGIFEEDLARFYIAELTCAIESVHRMGFIHRDIKPDNILIDRDGHIKLTDFGLCTGFRWTHNSKFYKMNGEQQQQCDDCCPSSASSPPLSTNINHTHSHHRNTNKLLRHKLNHPRCLAHSLVGTPNYIAPEVLLTNTNSNSNSQGYSQLCDWWSVGVILYEMLVGQPPFLAPTPAETQIKVVNWERTLRVPDTPAGGKSDGGLVGPEAKDLIMRLCTSPPNHRLGAGPNGAEEVKAHPFFAPYSKGMLDANSSNYIRRRSAPYIPRIAHPMDTSNFDPCDQMNNSQCSVVDGGEGDAEGSFHGFYEFTFRRFFDDAYNNNENGSSSKGGGAGVNPVYV